MAFVPSTQCRVRTTVSQILPPPARRCRISLGNSTKLLLQSLPGFPVNRYNTVCISESYTGTVLYRSDRSDRSDVMYLLTVQDGGVVWRQFTEGRLSWAFLVISCRFYAFDPLCWAISVCYCLELYILYFRTLHMVLIRQIARIILMQYSHRLSPPFTFPRHHFPRRKEPKQA